MGKDQQRALLEIAKQKVLGYLNKAGRQGLKRQSICIRSWNLICNYTKVAEKKIKN